MEVEVCERVKSNETEANGTDLSEGRDMETQDCGAGNPKPGTVNPTPQTLNPKLE